MAVRYAYHIEEEKTLKRKTELEFIVTKLKKSKHLNEDREEKSEHSKMYFPKANNARIFSSNIYLPRKPSAADKMNINGKSTTIKETFFVEDLLRKDKESFKKTSWNNEYHEKSKFIQRLESEHNKTYDNNLLNPNIEVKKEECDMEEGVEPNKSRVDKIPETKCTKCNKRFYRRNQLLRHLSNHVVHECKQCHAVFYCVRKYKKHMVTHESYPCEFCGEEFYDASLWYQHRAKHTMIECSSCDMIFYNKAALLKHRLNHLSYNCPICYHSCVNLNEWITHRSFHGKHFSHQILSPRLNCRECLVTFHMQEHFLNHQCIFSKKLSIEELEKKIERKHILNKEQKRLRVEHASVFSKYEPISAPFKSTSLVKKYRKTKFHSRWSDTQDFSHLIGVDQTISC